LAGLEMRVTQIFLLFFRNSFSLFIVILIQRVRVRIDVNLAGIVILLSTRTFSITSRFSYIQR
jgi:hypothetical protein